MADRLLITGAGRSGTHWMAQCLTLAGLPCGHELAYNLDRSGDWQLGAESSWLAAPFSPMVDAYVVHLIRHPLDAIRSLAERNVFGPPDPPSRWGQYAMQHLSGIGGSVVDRATHYWLGWNDLVSADAVVYLDDVTPELVTSLARLIRPAAPGITILPAPSNRQPQRLVSGSLGWPYIGIDEEWRRW